MAYEIDCDMCGGHAEGNNCKQVCIHCFNRAEKRAKKSKNQERKRILGLLNDWNSSSKHIHNTNHVSQEILNQLRKKINSENADD